MLISKKKSVFFAALVLALVAASGGVYYGQRYASERRVLKKYRETPQRGSSLTEGNIDWLKTGQELKTLLIQYPDAVSKRDEGVARLKLADVTRLSDRKGSMGLLKEIAADSSYPNPTRSAAINLLVDAYEELNFLGPNFEKQEDIIFSGERFGGLLNSAGGDMRLAIQKLNEWSLEVSPNAIAHYRLARWFAEELYQNPNHSKRDSYSTSIGNHIAAGDSLLLSDSTSKLSRVGLAYGLRARALHIAGRNTEAEESFKKSHEVLRTEPITIFQQVHLVQNAVFYSAFLSRVYGQNRAEEIQFLLSRIYDYFETTPEPDRRNMSLVSLFVAARDSVDVGYPFVDFDRSDIERFYKIYPRTKKITEDLDFSEYIKGHPLEAWVLR